MTIFTNKMWSLKVMYLCLFMTFGFSETQAAHVHGQANMTIAMDRQTVVVEVSIPGFDVVGFEHEPADSQQVLAIDTAIEALKDTDNWLSFEQGSCQKGDVNIENPLAPAESEGHSKHQNFEIVVHYMCDNPNELRSMILTIHHEFPSIEETEVQWLIHDKQGLSTVTKQHEKVRFR